MPLMTIAHFPIAGQADQRRLVRVVERRPEADGVVSLHLAACDGGVLPDWEPGAHIDLVLPGGLTRQYSLCGDPARRDVWTIGVLLGPNSRGGSRFIHGNLAAGDTLTIAGPRNNFGLVDMARYLFIAGGIGITPILPMVRRAAAAGAPWVLVYGGRTRRSMAFIEDIGRHAGGEVHLVPQDEMGHPDLPRFLAGHQPDMAVYCCGPGPLIDAVEARCLMARPASLHRERFAPSTKTEAVGDDDAFEVELARSGRRITVPEGCGLLATLEEAGYAITNSCRAGICGTCLLRVIDGTPQHNDDLLSDEQRAAGNLILPCVSRSRSKLLVLDL